MDHYISQYIDNELSLDEKIKFLQHVRTSKEFTEEAVTLLRQEKALSAVLCQSAPEVPGPEQGEKRMSRAAVGWAMAACLLMVLSFLAGTTTGLPGVLTRQAQVVEAAAQHRFIIHQQETSRVEIAGSFTNWQRVALTPTGVGGYWEVTLRVPAGEHKYAFIVDGSKRLPDPTVATQEADDFGTINSIINVET